MARTRGAEPRVTKGWGAEGPHITPRMGANAERMLNPAKRDLELPLGPMIPTSHANSVAAVGAGACGR